MPNISTSFTRLPLIPEAVLREHQVLEPTDHRFRAAARLLQALWREDRGLPIGTHTSPNGTRRKLGSRITAAAGRAGDNLLTPGIAYLARREVAYREPGALIDEARLWTNLLSSMPLCFNLLGPLALDLALATRVLHHLCPDLAEGGAAVRAVWFEHSPGRGSATLTADGTAFDALIRYETPTGRTGFAAIEVKYSEALTEPVAALRPRYDELSRLSSLFKDPDAPALRTNPLQQLWRLSLLAAAMLLRGDADEGRVLTIAPRLNHLVGAATATYQTHFIEPRPAKAGFCTLTLEQVIEAIGLCGEPAYARALHRRYADFALVDGEIELALCADLARRRRRDPGGGEVEAPRPLRLGDGGRR